ncbi:amino acid ABC transporter permease [Nocardioides panacis]|uniref:Amino acid ABC transporter permease n=1 Tax=Nocardioides panacis TaxID=2849501 RepID=A0A975T4H7_9ACTN|nr:amino acid ABC transporter permease [Nocardioides panacis]
MRVRRRLDNRARLVAGGTTVAVLVLLLVGLTGSPGWPRVKETFLSWPDAKAAFPAIASAFWVNVRMFLVAEPLILVVGVLVAVARGTVAPVLFPVRALAVLYTDLFRGVPTLLVVFLVAFGLPALRLQGVTTSLFWLGVLALVLSYGAYVAEVFRSGIEGVHPSQVASAQALGLSHAQSLRFVVVPQAVRRVVPPLLNDFVSLQKDTALVASVGLVEALRQAQVYSSFNFNFSSYLVAAAFFVALTIPLARLTDWLGRRYARRERAGAR